MSQLTLFESSEMRLTDDERGRVVYTPRFVDADTADAWSPGSHFFGRDVSARMRQTRFRVSAVVLATGPPASASRRYRMRM
jgi:hypothetical protein